MRNYKDKTLAALLALFGGIFGLHRFYLGQNGKGFIMILLSIFSLGVVTSIIGIIDFVAFLSMNQETFDFKYNNPDDIVRRSPRYRSYDRRYQTSEFGGQGNSPYRRDRRIKKAEYQRQTNQKKSGPKKSRKTKRKSRKQDLKTINALQESGIEKFRDYDIEGSIRDFKKVLELDPYHIAAHFNLACAYSQIEKPEKTMRHIHYAVSAGFNDFNRIKTHEKLAYARIQPEWEEFEKNGFILDVQAINKETPEKEKTQDIELKETGNVQQENENKLNNDPSGDLLVHLKNLKEQREKGIITEVEFELERRKLMSS